MGPAYSTAQFIVCAILLMTWPHNAFSSESVYSYKDSLTDPNGLPHNVNVGINKSKAPYQIKKIVIDAGHGGNDPGCVGSKVTEKEIALKIALNVGRRIQDMHPDVEIIYTRKTDVFLPLHKRAEVANRAHADLFISIHCNAAGSKQAYGTETFVLGLHRAKDNLDVAKRENEAIYMEEDYEANYEGYDPNSPAGHILLSFFQNAFLNQSIEFAEKVEKNFVSKKRHSRGVKQGGLLVLRHATMPAVLIEAGFLSNINEEAYLMTQKGQDEISESIAKAFSTYKVQSESFQPMLAEFPQASDHSGQTMVSSNDMQDPFIEFCVQFMSSPHKSVPEMKKFQSWGNIKVRKESNTYKYQIASMLDYETASAKKDLVHSKGYKDAFIVAYKSGQRIPVHEAIAIQSSTASK